MMKLYGSPNSPYVRRVRIACVEYGVPFELIDTMNPEGQRQLREHTPIWKVPTALLDGEVILDSHLICAVLSERFGAGQIATPSTTDVTSRNLLHVVDGLLDSMIQVFYWRRERLDEALPLHQKQLERAAAALAYLEARLPPAGPTLTEFEVNLASAITWMQLRKTCSIAEFQALLAYVARVETRPSLVATAPS